MYQHLVEDLFIRRSITDIAKHLAFLGDLRIFFLLFFLVVFLCLGLILFKLDIKYMHHYLVGTVYLGTALACAYCLFYPAWLEGRSPDIHGPWTYYPSRESEKHGSVNIRVGIGLSEANISIFNHQKQILFSEVIDIHSSVEYWWFPRHISSVVEQLTADEFSLPIALRLAGHWCWWLLVGSLVVLSFSLLTYLANPNYGARFLVITAISLLSCGGFYTIILKNEIKIYVDGQRVVFTYGPCAWTCFLTGLVAILFAVYLLFTQPKCQERLLSKERTSLEELPAKDMPRTIYDSLHYTQ